MKVNDTLSDHIILQELGSRLARLRLNRNLTQAALAKEAGISLRTLNRIECGEPSQTANLIRVLRALGQLQNLDILVPEPVVSPLQQLRLQGKTRKRASRPGAAGAGEQVAEEPWHWNVQP